MGFFDKLKQLKKFDETLAQKVKEAQDLDNQISEKTLSIEELKNKEEFVSAEIEKLVAKRDAEKTKTKNTCEQIIKSYEARTATAKENYEQAHNEYKILASNITKSSIDFELLKEKAKLYKSFIRKASKHIQTECDFADELQELSPTVELHLNAFDVKDLRALIRENRKITDNLLVKYEQRYNTKSNRTIYQLMVLALRAELQNILVDLKYSNIEKCKNNLDEMINKFMTIASDGNQQIAPTIKSFIEEIHILFDQAVDIEYEYFIRKEQEKAEQQALREQMRQEMEERRALELEQKKVEKEETKYKSEIENTEESLANCKDDAKMKQLLARIEELKNLLNKVEERKEDILNRQNGQAGYVYIISNLGSFGENRFKVGMTRRLEPMDRVKELGGASVPFAFDVHSFIFSDDAVKLEKELHNRLHEKRTNKINLRKEFFDVSLNEIESLVGEICPTAEFRKTMIALEYKRSLEMQKSI